ncbi:LysM peptidoglycan-binding domain-containing protein [Shouchella lehensis]|uniref:Coat assembly-involved SpoIVD-associated protein n=1 Tax=Shouchella lehensis G1 TaxID=1246626 RepID=A0A060M077_9BACI|nr:LysM peptidoglycan-binding domain-containing protein [Shouchella lehensis]AIC93948.1 coat assembly-involved SpoIVD-associated protein [Shouchella lehensis G1]
MRIHIVQKGDTVGKLADKYDLSLNQIKQANSTITNPDVLMPGMKVKIPSPTVAVRKETSVKEPNKEPKKPLLNKKEKLEPLKKPATNTTELDSISALKTLAQPPKSASYSSEPKPLPPKQACSSCGTYPKTPPHVPNQQVNATNQSISPQSMNETHYMQEMTGNSPSLMNQWSTTNESSSVESMMNSTNGNHHAPMQQGMGGNHHAPMQQGMGGNHHAPMQQGMGGNHHASMQQGLGGNHHASMQQGLGNQQQPPTFVKKDGQWNSANQSWFYPQMDSYAPQIEQYGHTQNEYGYREASAHNQVPQWETMHGMQASYAPYEPKEQVNNYDEKDTHED